MMEKDYQDIFISYRRSDGFAFAEGLANALKSQGFSVFFDKKSIDGGTLFTSAIGDALDHALEIIPIITPEYFDTGKGAVSRINQPSDWVRKELVRALRQDNARIFPILINCEPPRKEQLPRGIRKITTYNFIPYNPAFDTYEKIIEKLTSRFHMETRENAKIGMITKQLDAVDVHDPLQFNVVCKKIINHLEDEHGRNALIHILEMEKDCVKYYPSNYRYIVFYTLFSYYRRMHQLLELLALVEKHGSLFLDYPFTQYVFMEYYQTKYKLETDPAKIPCHILSALDCAKKAVKALPGNNGILHSFCVAVALAGENGVESDKTDRDLAMELVDRIISGAPNYALYFCTKARLQANIGEYEAALINLKLAQNLERPEHNDWILRIADYYRQEIMIRLRRNDAPMSSVKNAGVCRNPYSPRLVRFAHEQGAALEGSCGVPGARHTLSGSLGYDAALKGCYDIDLSLLVPDAGKTPDEVRRQIVAVKDLLAKRARDDSSFKSWFIDEGAGSYIWHTKQFVKLPVIPGNPDIELSWNIQAESSYHSIAEMASRLPKDVIDRFVVAKWNAWQVGKDAYKTLTGEWKSLINFLNASNALGMNDAELGNFLASIADQYPKFLKKDNS